MYRPMVAMRTTAKNAHGTVVPGAPLSAGNVMMAARTHMRMTDMYGTRWRLSRVHMRWPGTARSRENAKHMRDALVTHDIPQNSWPTVAARITNFAFALDSALSTIA